MDEKYEKLGQAIDTLENLAFGLKMPILDKMHVQALQDALPDLVERMKEGFIEATGENPWATWEAEEE